MAPHGARCQAADFSLSRLSKRFLWKDREEIFSSSRGPHGRSDSHSPLSQSQSRHMCHTTGHGCAPGQFGLEILKFEFPVLLASQNILILIFFKTT